MKAHPEWWMLALSVAAWLALLAPVQSGVPVRLCLGPSPEWHAGSVRAAVRLVMRLDWLPLLAQWAMMVVAMMLPLTVTPARFVAFRSLWCRRHRAIAGFLAGFLGVWLLAGVGYQAAHLLAESLGLAGGFAVTPGLCLLALVWQGSGLKAQALLDCHRTVPLAPRGLRANLDCLGFGLRHGCSCLLSCWLLMLLPALPHHQPAIMAGVSAVMLAERLRKVSVMGSCLMLLALYGVWSVTSLV